MRKRWLLRRAGFAIGFALLVGGWGTTRYADEQQQSIKQQYRIRAWLSGRYGERYQWGDERFLPMPTCKIYQTGVVSMAFGAGFVGFSLPRNRAEQE